MKKLISIICILIIVLLVFLWVEYAYQGQPSNIAINNAVSWAKSLVGKTSFAFYGGGSSESYNHCADFTANSYGCSYASVSAYMLWTTLDNKHPGDWNAPRGSLVFFDRIGMSGPGHVALCTGNGNLVEGGYLEITKSTIKAENNVAPYLGWAWPPSYWHGRSRRSAAAVHKGEY